MRVIAGLHRSRKLLAPKDASTTRPITDRVKTSLFDRLTATGVFGPSCAVLDLFAGTGSLGIEALSRGAGHCTFVERDKAVLSLLSRNLELLDLRTQATVVPGDALGPGLIPRLWHKPYHVIFCDPPYVLTNEPDEAAKVAQQLARLAEVAAPDAWMTLRTSDHAEAPAVPGWDGPAEWNYGSMTIWVYRRLAE
jgi:16S rRNA (guanine966-N2)-methyltransferase